MKVVDFLQLTAKLPYPPSVKGELSQVHSTLVDQVIASYTGKHVERVSIIHAFNCVSYMYLSSDSKPLTWNKEDPLHTYQDRDEFTLQELLKDMYVYPKDVDWSNVAVVESADENTSTTKSVTVTEEKVETATATSTSDIKVKLDTLPVSTAVYSKIATNTSKPTDKCDLYIQPPLVPRFDTSHPFASGVVDDCAYTIYPSYPIIPTKQNEISVTTDVNKMSQLDLLKLFPNCLIRTRAACMYEPCEGIELDPVLGLILPVEGYTRNQLIDNLVRYPHIFKLQKVVDGQVESFYSTLEVDEELHKISEYWSELPESKVIPYTKEFIKEYVVRRYLLERDVKGIKHRYSIYGSLDPFLTLFTSPEGYSTLGYSDTVKLAYDCVLARVSYKKSRNPVLRRLANV